MTIVIRVEFTVQRGSARPDFDHVSLLGDSIDEPQSSKPALAVRNVPGRQCIALSTYVNCSSYS